MRIETWVYEWVLRGFLSTNTWENIDQLVEQYDLQSDELRKRNLDDYRGDDPTPSRNEVLDKIFEYFTEDAEEGERRKLWDEITQFIQEENARCYPKRAKGKLA
tara:strand:+ start:1220 stop:1531 length:312 start_codon:yes stop_codon:yes gene_type:complete